MEKAILLNNTHPDYCGIKWALKAISKDETRYQLHFLNIQDADVVATDGKRLHNYFLKQSFESGLYNPFCVSNKIILIQSEETAYPEWKKLFLDIPSTRKIKVPATTNSEYINTSYAKLIRLMDEGQGFNLSYWNDILSFGTEYEVRWYEFEKQIIFINSTHRAVIMPMNLGENGKGRMVKSL